MSRILGYKNHRNLILTYGVILVFAIIGYFVRRAKFEQLGADVSVDLIWVSIALMTVFWESLRLINNGLDRLMPFDRGLTLRIVVQLVAGALVGLAIRALIYYFGEPFLPFKLDELFLAATWVIYFFLPGVVNLGFFTVHFIERWRDSLVIAERLEKEKAHVQFDNLKNQLNPHFLFNALSSLNSLIQEDQKLASEFLQQLAKVYRYVLQHRDKNAVSLRVELEFVSQYVSLLRTRFGPAIDIRFEVEMDKLDASIVPVTLQILIENALKHNVADRSRPLVIEVTTTQSWLEVRNNLQLRSGVKESNRQGLENLKSLYSFFTQDAVQSENTGTHFVVRIPLLS